MRELVWLDFRLSIVVAVLAPLVLLVGAALSRNRVIYNMLVTYWRVSSLLGITIFLLIGSLPIAFLVGWVARILIPVSLWWWRDLNAELQKQRGPLRSAFLAWRWGITAYFAAGTVMGLLFLPCAFLPPTEFTDTCRLVLEVPLLFKQLVFYSIPIPNLRAFGIAMLVVFLIFFSSYLLFTFPERGRLYK
ncbi:MAG: DUF3177 family protein [Pseudanabaenaceae cyanobacterium SKYGB_i_bin29]|nr:DUF3177 family protein [Pseudanabaenaceae cyanobacterium SKYG29]MDW8421168.1 DUF3177 family protein [Pseudanabaenaceae cyanobacterium SKYGB_i_bin29]